MSLNVKCSECRNKDNVISRVELSALLIFKTFINNMIFFCVFGRKTLGLLSPGYEL